MELRIDDTEYKLTDFSAADIKMISESLAKRHDAIQSGWGTAAELKYGPTSDVEPGSRRVDRGQEST